MAVGSDFRVLKERRFESVPSQPRASSYRLTRDVERFQQGNELEDEMLMGQSVPLREIVGKERLVTFKQLLQEQRVSSMRSSGETYGCTHAA